MKKFMLLHVGFEKPTPEIMTAWGKWMESVKDNAVEHGGFLAGKEVSRTGVKELPSGMESLTGYSIIQAENQEEAEKIARKNPFIAAIRIYEIRN